MNSIKTGIKYLIDGKNLDIHHASAIMREIMEGKANNSLIASFLTALVIRGEKPEVIAGSAQTMRNFSKKIYPKINGRLVDIVGTGGDKSYTFNISTLAGLVAAGAGVSIAKHGNRSVSSKCGSADLLESLGVNISLKPKEVEKIISDIGFGFLFAPKFHPAMKYAVPVRKSLGIRTIFNILGPLTNPASASGYLIGVYDKELIPLMAESLLEIGVEHAFIVNSSPGIDEIIPISEVYFAEIKDNKITYYSKFPDDFSLPKFSLQDIQTKSLEENRKLAINILENKEKSVKKDIVVINAAYGILASGITSDFNQAKKLAENSLESGSALKKLNELVNKSNNFNPTA